jgi:hypothetical protein
MCFCWLYLCNGKLHYLVVLIKVKANIIKIEVVDDSLEVKSIITKGTHMLRKDFK